MKWSREGDILRLRDKHGWTRALLYLEQGVSYIGVAPFGTSKPASEFGGANKAQLKKKLVEVVKQAGIS